MDDILLYLILIVVSVLGTIITRVVVPYLKAKLNKEQMEFLESLIKKGLFAAEQVYNERGQGKTKKEYVYEYVREKVPNLSYSEFEIILEGTGKALNIFGNTNKENTV